MVMQSKKVAGISRKTEIEKLLFLLSCIFCSLRFGNEELIAYMKEFHETLLLFEGLKGDMRLHCDAPYQNP